MPIIAAQKRAAFLFLDKCVIKRENVNSFDIFGRGQGFFAPILFVCFLVRENSGAKARSEAKRNEAILSQSNSHFF